MALIKEVKEQPVHITAEVREVGRRGGNKVRVAVVNFQGDFQPYYTGIKKVERIIDNLEACKTALEKAKELEADLESQKE